MKLKILSWNIWYKGFFDEACQFLKDSKADIIGLQEVVENDKTRDMVNYLSVLGYHHIYAPAVEKDGKVFGNGIFSKYPIVSNETYILSETESRNAVRADIKIGEKILHFFSVHLLHTHQKVSEIQNQQVDSLVNVLPQDKLIVMGDFNALPKSYPIKKMKSVMVDTESGPATPTWSLYVQGCSVCKLESLDYKLDYIFTNSDIKTKSFRVEQSKGSDHLPVSVIIEVNEKC